MATKSGPSLWNKKQCVGMSLGLNPERSRLGLAALYGMEWERKKEKPSIDSSSPYSTMHWTQPCRKILSRFHGKP